MARTPSTRAAIRHYLINMLKDNVDVGKRVFQNRETSPLFLEELPVVCVKFGHEVNDVIVGSEFRPKEYQRELTVTISAVVDDTINPDVDINENQQGEDKLDWLMEQVEHAIEFDWRLARRLPGFSVANKTPGLTFGSRQTGTVTYSVETDDERRLIAQDTTYVFPYNTHTYRDLKLPDFNAYYAAIIRVGSDENTTDRVLLDAEGEL